MEKKEIKYVTGNKLISELLNFLKRPTVLVGIAIASIHFIIFAFLFESPPSFCSSPKLLSAFPLAPTYFLSFLPIISDLLSIIASVLRTEDNFVVFISSCYYGLAIGLTVSRQKKHRLIGITLIGISILTGFFMIFASLATGCGA